MYSQNRELCVTTGGLYSKKCTLNHGFPTRYLPGCVRRSAATFLNYVCTIKMIQ
jgi:hypothetical protein